MHNGRCLHRWLGDQQNRKSHATTPRAAHRLHHLQVHAESVLPVAKRNFNIVTQASVKLPTNSGFVKQSSHGV